MLLFNREGDWLAAKLRPGNLHSAEGREEMLLPEIERQQKAGKEVMFRADAAFAKPEIYEAPAIRIPSNDSLERELLTAGRQTELQAGGLVQGLSVPGRELEDSAPGGGQGGVSLWGVVSAGRLHCDECRPSALVGQNELIA